MSCRNHLSLVKNKDAVANIVQLAALGGSVGVHGLEELHGGSDHDGGIPVFRGEGKTALLCGDVGIGIEKRSAVMLQNIFIP